MNEKWDEIQGKLDFLSEFEISGFYATNKGKKKTVKLIVQTSFAEKLKQKGARPSKTSFVQLPTFVM